MGRENRWWRQNWRRPAASSPLAAATGRRPGHRQAARCLAAPRVAMRCGGPPTAGCAVPHPHTPRTLRSSAADGPGRGWRCGLGHCRACHRCGAAVLEGQEQVSGPAASWQPRLGLLAPAARGAAPPVAAAPAAPCRGQTAADAPPFFRPRLRRGPLRACLYSLSAPFVSRTKEL